MQYVLLALVLGVVIFILGYAFRGFRLDENAKASRRVIRENVTLQKQNEALSAGLKDIAAGRGGVPEITASAALAEARSYSKEN